jgi:hypothetical protein
LEECGLASHREDMDSQPSGTTTPTGTKCITLDTPIATGGENLSQGKTLGCFFFFFFDHLLMKFLKLKDSVSF